MKVVWSPRALDRVSQIALRIARDNPDAADRWVVSVFERVERVQDFARSGRRVPEVGRPDIREVLYGNYRIIYRVEPERVGIITHGGSASSCGPEAQTGAAAPRMERPSSSCAKRSVDEGGLLDLRRGRALEASSRVAIRKWLGHPRPAEASLSSTSLASALRASDTVT
jgi:plasmid stabilization system protein ParE